MIKSKFVNLKVRQLSAETCHDFIEWCGLIGGEENSHLEKDRRLYKQDLYFDFITEYPDYGPKAKMTISRTKFYKWLVSYCLFSEGVQPEDGRDSTGRWMRIRNRHEDEHQTEMSH